MGRAQEVFPWVAKCAQGRDGMRHRDESQHDPAVFRWAAAEDLHVPFEKATGRPGLYDLLNLMSRVGGLRSASERLVGRTQPDDRV